MTETEQAAEAMASATKTFVAGELAPLDARLRALEERLKAIETSVGIKSAKPHINLKVINGGDDGWTTV